jgi:hypothetical protein
MNNIISFMHCKKCLEELPEDTSPRNWAMLEIGWTVKGFQVWCKRHEENVIHLDFEGQKHPIAQEGPEDLEVFFARQKRQKTE